MYLDFTLPYAIVFNIEECHINLNNGDILIEGRNTPHTKEKLQDNDDLKFNVCYLQFTNIGQLH